MWNYIYTYITDIICKACIYRERERGRVPQVTGISSKNIQASRRGKVRR